MANYCIEEIFPSRRYRDSTQYLGDSGSDSYDVVVPGTVYRVRPISISSPQALIRTETPGASL